MTDYIKTTYASQLYREFQSYLGKFPEWWIGSPSHGESKYYVPEFNITYIRRYDDIQPSKLSPKLYHQVKNADLVSVFQTEFVSDNFLIIHTTVTTIYQKNYNYTEWTSRDDFYDLKNYNYTEWASRDDFYDLEMLGDVDDLLAVVSYMKMLVD